MDFLNAHGIAWYSTFNEGKAVVIERFNRTLKERLYKKLTHLDHKKWVSIIQDVVDAYNDSSLKNKIETHRNIRKIGI